MHNLIQRLELSPGNIVKCFVGEKFDGYAVLLEPDGEGMSFIKSDHSAVYVKWRWRVQFCHPDILGNMKLTRSEIWDQKSKAGIKTHRYFIYLADINYTTYFNKHGGEPEDKPKTNKDAILLIDKPNEIF